MNSIGEAGASAIWPGSPCPTNGLSGSIDVSDKDAWIATEGELVPEPVGDAMVPLGEGAMAELLSACVGDDPGDGGFIHVGVIGRTNPARRVASLSR